MGQLVTDDYDLEPPAATPPSVSITSPTDGSTVSGVQTVSATATDSNGIQNVQFKLDGANLGAADTTAPYSVSWDTKTASNSSHILSAVVTNTSNVTATSSNVNVTVNNPLPPSVSFTAPANGATVSGNSVAVSADATDAVGVAGVQFKLDGANLGAEDTTAPYNVTWDTTTAGNGSHSLSATARNTSGLTATTTESVNVQNTIITPPPPPPNLIPNSSLENSTNGTDPDSWFKSRWGNNTASLTYLNTGHTGSHSVRVDITQFTDGAADWYHNPVVVTAGKTYKFEDWYQSNVDSVVYAQISLNDGSTQYQSLGTAAASSTWAKFSATLTAPSNVKNVVVYQPLTRVGYLISDDYSLSEYTPLAFSRGIVSITFDDGWSNQYSNALPLLKQYGQNATFYIISGDLSDQPNFVSPSQVQDMQSAGMEIGSHTITHPDLTTVSQTQLVNEMSQSQATLQNLLGVPVTDFAYPYGAYNQNTISVGSQYYQSQRTVNSGYNTRDNLDLTQLKIEEVYNTTTVAQVQSWVQDALNQKAWLILTYHEIADTPIDPNDATYTTKPSNLDAELSYIKNSGIAVETVHQAIGEILPQL